MNQPLVSIIMNCYNSEKFLREALESVYSQTYQNWEIIFWDNASKDQSASIAKSYDNKIKYYSVAETSPLGEARNLALNKASGKYIAFLDCDDLYLPLKLEVQVKLMEQNNYAMCYGSSIHIDHKACEIKKVNVKNESGMIFSKLLSHYEINMQSVMIRRALLVNESLNFEKKLKYCPDHNLFMRIACQYPIGVISDYIVKYRVLNDSLSAQTIDIAPTEVEFTLDQIEKLFPNLSQSLKREFRDAYSKVKYYHMIACLSSGDRLRGIRYISPIMFVRYEYFCIFILLLTPIPSTLILKILGR